MSELEMDLSTFNPEHMDMVYHGNVDMLCYKNTQYYLSKIIKKISPITKYCIEKLLHMDHVHRSYVMDDFKYNLYIVGSFVTIVISEGDTIRFDVCMLYGSRKFLTRLYSM